MTDLRRSPLKCALNPSRQPDGTTQSSFPILDIPEQISESQPDDLRPFEPGQTSQLVEDVNVAVAQSDGRDFRHPETLSERLPGPLEQAYNRHTIDSPQPERQSQAKALPLGWLLAPKSAQLGDDRPLDSVPLATAYDRILAKLTLWESKEPNEHFKTDFRIAWHIVRISQTGEAKICTAAVLAWFQVCNCHPDHVWPRIVAARKAKLGPEYSLWYDEHDVLRPDVVIPDFDPLLASAMHRARPAGAGEPPRNKRSAPVPLQPTKEGIA